MTLSYSDEPTPVARRKAFGTATRNQITLRDGARCARCLRTDDLHIDHVVPLSRGGSNDINNLRFLCRACNLHKGSRLDSEIPGWVDRSNRISESSRSEPDALTIREVAASLGKDRRTVRRQLDAGRYPNAYREPGPTGRWLIPVADLNVAGYRTGGPSNTTSIVRRAWEDELARLRAEKRALETRASIAEALAAERKAQLDHARGVLYKLSINLGNAP